jgi:hypothetical protein
MKNAIALLLLLVAAYFGYEYYSTHLKTTQEEQQVLAIADEFNKVIQSADQGARASGLASLDMGFSLDQDVAKAEVLKKRLAELTPGLTEAKAREKAKVLEMHIAGFIQRKK